MGGCYPIHVVGYLSVVSRLPVETCMFGARVFGAHLYWVLVWVWCLLALGCIGTGVHNVHLPLLVIRRRHLRWTHVHTREGELCVYFQPYLLFWLMLMSATGGLVMYPPVLLLSTYMWPTWLLSACRRQAYMWKHWTFWGVQQWLHHVYYWYYVKIWH